MDLEQLKVIWDADHKASHFTLHEGNLHAIVQRRIEASQRSAACRYRAETSISLALAAMTLGLAAILAFGVLSVSESTWPKVPPSNWDLVGLGLAGGVWLYFAWYLQSARQRLQQRGESFDSSLRGDLDRALARLDFEIKIARDIVWRGFIPLYAAIILTLTILFRLSIDPVRSGALKTSYMMVALVMTTAFAVDVVCRRQAIRKRYEPQHRELDSLRRKLVDPRQ